MFQIGKANFNEQPNNTVTWSYKREVPQFGKGRKLLAVPKWLISISLGSMMRSKEDCPEGSGLGLLFSLCKQNHFVLRDKQQRHLIFIFKKRLSWSKCFGVFFFWEIKKNACVFSRWFMPTESYGMFSYTRKNVLGAFSAQCQDLVPAQGL